MNALRRELKRLKQVLARTARQGDAPEYFAAWRAVLRLYQEVSRDRSDPEPSKEEEDEKEYQELWSLAGEAILNLGGQAEPTLTTLDQYACDRYGPMLGVSDEGSAAAAIRRGALASPKCIVLRQLTPMTIGVAHDAERLGGVGEVVVGPKEYSTIRLACMGRILTTTNVGTRVNLRNYSDPPVVKLKADRPEKAVASASKKLRELFEPFWKTLSGKPRHLTVLVHFDDRAAPEQREAVFNGLQAALATREFCNPRVLQGESASAVAPGGAARGCATGASESRSRPGSTMQSEGGRGGRSAATRRRRSHLPAGALELLPARGVERSASLRR